MLLCGQKGCLEAPLHEQWSQGGFPQEFRKGGHLVIVKLQPLLAIWTDESVAVAPVHAFAVHKHAVQLVHIPDD